MTWDRKQSIVKKTVLLALFLVPIAYISQILAVAIHEIIGHGLAAVALGGTFHGFVLIWDGMGYAYSNLPLDVSTKDRIVFFAAGAMASTVTGVVLLALGYIIRKRLAIRISLLIASFSCLMEGIPYIFWNLYHPVTPGDMGQIVALWRAAELPSETGILIFLLFLSGAAFITSTFFLCALLFQAIESALLGGNLLSSRARFILLFLFLVVPGTGAWFLFDWNQIAPGLGLLPAISGAGSILISAIVLYRFPLKPFLCGSGINIKWYHLLISWGSLVVTIVFVLFWCQKGVIWA